MATPKLIQSPFSFPKPPPLCPISLGATAAPRSCPSLRRGCAGAGAEALPCIILYGFQPSCSLVLQAAWRGACGGSAAFATCPSDLDLSLEKIREGGGGASLPVSAACTRWRGRGRPAPTGPPARRPLLSRYRSPGMALPVPSQKNKPGGDSCPLALWGSEWSRRDLGSPALVISGRGSTWRAKSGAGGCWWSLSPAQCPCPCSMSRLTLKSQRLFKELLMSKSARFIGCGEQSCSPAFF